MAISKYIIFSFALLVSTNLEAQPDLPKEDFHIFVLMGQSNMAGFATLIDTDTISQNDMYNLLGQKKSKWGTEIEPGTEEIKWVKAKHPLHKVHNSDRYGLAIDFGKEYLKSHPGVKIGFIPCAIGGAPIENLNKGTETYTNALERISYAKESGTIKGILWHQGESNTVELEIANGYEFKLHQLIKNLRTDIKMASLPFIVGDLASFYGIDRNPDHTQGIIIVRNTLRNLPSKIPNTGFVESVGLFWQGEGYVHFDRDSYKELGKRYHKEYTTLLNK